MNVSMRDLSIFRATAKNKFSVYFLLPNDLKCQTHNLKTEEKQLLFK